METTINIAIPTADEIIDAVIVSMTRRLAQHDYSGFTDVEMQQLRQQGRMIVGLDEDSEQRAKRLHSEALVWQWMQEVQQEQLLSRIPECLGCGEEMVGPTQQWIKLNDCGHDWCAGCLERNIEQAMQSRTTWPPRCCVRDQGGVLLPVDLARAARIRCKALITDHTYGGIDSPRPLCPSRIGGVENERFLAEGAMQKCPQL
ncbi:hypothetical protein DV735_g270, partial [Chaetothyriales sp. CBS 134920]